MRDERGPEDREGQGHQPLAVDMRLALADFPFPNDVIPTDPEEIRERGDTLGRSPEKRQTVSGQSLDVRTGYRLEDARSDTADCT